MLSWVRHLNDSYLFANSILNPRECTPRLSIIFALRVSTVLTVIASTAAISLLVFPLAGSLLTWVSRTVGLTCEACGGTV